MKCKSLISFTIIFFGCVCGCSVQEDTDQYIPTLSISSVPSNTKIPATQTKTFTPTRAQNTRIPSLIPTKSITPVPSATTDMLLPLEPVIIVYHICDFVGLKFFDPDEQRLTTVPIEDFDIIDKFSFSPDQEWVAVAKMVHNKPGNFFEIFTIRLDGKERRRLSFGEFGAFGPDWSPDGKFIVYSKQTEFDVQLAMVSVDGKEASIIANGGYSPSWSPDGSKIAYISLCKQDNDQEYCIYTIQTDGKKIAKITSEVNIWSPLDWSPDGQWIVYSSGGKNIDIYKVNTVTGEIIRLTNSCLAEVSPIYSFDGNHIYYISKPPYPNTCPTQTQKIFPSSIFVMNADGSAQTLLHTAKVFVGGGACEIEGMTLIRK